MKIICSCDFSFQYFTVFSPIQQSTLPYRLAIALIQSISPQKSILLFHLSPLLHSLSATSHTSDFSESGNLSLFFFLVSPFRKAHFWSLMCVLIACYRCVWELNRNTCLSNRFEDKFLEGIVLEWQNWRQFFLFSFFLSGSIGFENHLCQYLINLTLTAMILTHQFLIALQFIHFLLFLLLLPNFLSPQAFFHPQSKLFRDYLIFIAF